MKCNQFNILITDDHPIIREGIIRILENDKNILNIYEAGRGDEALAIIKEKKPEVVLMDISLPDMSGIEVIKEVFTIPEMVGVVNFLVISIYNSPEYYYRALKAGACGLIPKGTPRLELYEGIYKTLNGEQFFGSGVCEGFIENLLAFYDEIDFQSHDPENIILSPREKEIIILIYQGMQTKQIADKLGIGIRTVETHRATFMAKLNVTTLAQLTSVVKNSDKLTKLIYSEGAE